jgi:hypothetical protein
MTRRVLLTILSLTILALPLGCRRSSTSQVPEGGPPATNGGASQPTEPAAGQPTSAEKPAPTLPADYPQDVPIWPKAKVTSSTVVDKKTAVRFETDAPVSDVVSFYNSALQGSGWEVLATTNSKSGSVLGATKSGRTLNVIVAKGERATLITLGLDQP